MDRLQRFAVPLLLLLGAADAALALTARELQDLLQRSHLSEVSFVETRESPWLERPVVTRGKMIANADALEKRVEAPRKETWRLLTDRVEYVDADVSKPKQILFAQAPAVGLLANTLRRVVAGDLLALERDFRIVVDGELSEWTVHMKPTSTEAARYLDHVEMRGSHGNLREIAIVERQGERTLTRLSPR